MGKAWKHQRDDAGSMLATVIVVVLGALVCGFLVAASTESGGDWLLWTIVGVAVFFITWVMWYRYSRRTASPLSFWFALSRNYRDDEFPADYVPRKVRTRQADVAGPNRPITADEARELQQNSANTWVPSRNRCGSTRS